MEVDAQIEDERRLGEGSKLKRSSSAPLISITAAACWSPSTSGSSSLKEPLHRTRTMSTSSGCPLSPVVPRVHQIKSEEMEGVAMREAQQERELTSKLAISQSWDDLSIDEAIPAFPGSSCRTTCRNVHSPLHVFTPPCSSPVGCGSPSPKQCYSPSMRSLRAPSSPSPTRVQRHRSQSPQLLLRPSSLSVKRKLSDDGESTQEDRVERAKRLLTLDSDKEDRLLLPVASGDV